MTIRKELDRLAGRAAPRKPKRQLPAFAGAMRGGSPNLALLDVALHLQAGPATEVEREAISYLRWEKKEFGWMGVELATNHHSYGILHRICELEIIQRAADPILIQLAKERFMTWAWACNQCEFGGRHVLVGMRGADQMTMDRYDFDDYLYDIVCGRRTQSLKGIERRPEKLIIDKYVLVAKSLYPAQEWLSNWRVKTPIHFYKGPNGSACWVEKNINGNTPPCLGACNYGDGISYLPPASSVYRKRQTFDNASCRRVAHHLEFHSDLFGDHQLMLPRGGCESVWKP